MMLIMSAIQRSKKRRKRLTGRCRGRGRTKRSDVARISRAEGVTKKNFLPSLDEEPSPVIQMHKKIRKNPLTRAEEKEATGIVIRFQREPDIMDAMPTCFQFRIAKTEVVEKGLRKFATVCRIRGTHVNSRHRFNPTEEYRNLRKRELEARRS